MPSNIPPHSERWAPQEPYAQPPPPKKSKTPWILAVILGLILVAGCGGAAAFIINGGSGPSDDPGPVVTHTLPPSHATAAPKAAVRVGQVNAGTYKVGTEVKAGTWTTKANHGPCYWERLKDFSGEFDAIIANGNLDEGEQGRLVVKATDKGVHFTGPCVWTKE